jgi:hypothetical protein
VRYRLCIALVVLAVDPLGQGVASNPTPTQAPAAKKKKGTTSTNGPKPAPTPASNCCGVTIVSCQTPCPPTAPAKPKKKTQAPTKAANYRVHEVLELGAQNAPAILTDLATDTHPRIKLVADGNSRIIVFCKIPTPAKVKPGAEECPQDDLRRIEWIINKLSEPQNAGALAVDLPFFCLSGVLHGPRPRLIFPWVGPSRCDAQRRIQASNAADIETALSKDASFTVKAEGAIRLLVSCKKACSQLDFNRIRAGIIYSARPTPSYVEDVDVPEGRAKDIATNIGLLKLMGITADPIGTAKIRLKSDTPVSESDVIAITRQYLFGGHVPPAFRMFYQLPSVVVPAMAPPPSGAGGTPPAAPAPTPAAAPAAASTSTSGTAPGAFTITSKTDASVTPPGSPAGGDGTDTGATGSTPKPASSATTTTSTTTTTVTPPTPPAPTPTPTPAPPPVGAGMAPVVDNVVFTDTSSEELVRQRVRLLTMLDLPRPEVLMNVWSYQASSPDGNEVLRRSEQVRDLVSAHNDALEDSIQYGWAYLSREMNQDALHRTPGDEEREPSASSECALPTTPTQNFPPCTPSGFFDHEFYDYITQKFVGDPDGRLGTPDRTKWGFCPVAKYCLGYTHAFQPVRPNLTSILMGAMAASHPLSTILTTIGCMEGKYEVYGLECFPDRPAFNLTVQRAADDDLMYSRSAKDAGSGEKKKEEKERKEKEKRDNEKRSRDRTSSSDAASGTVACSSLDECRKALRENQCLIDRADEDVARAQTREQCEVERTNLEGQLTRLKGQASELKTRLQTYVKDIEAERSCLRLQRRKLMSEKPYKDRVSCEVLDAVALDAQETCGLAQTLPLSCFTIEAAQAFSSPTSFSTFTLKDLNELAEEPIARSWVVTDADDRPADQTYYGTTRIGLLRAAVADFLFNYKMSQEFPRDFAPYDLQHSAQELNAELNPLVLAFNQDVAAYSQHLSDKLDVGSSSFPQVWRNHRSFLSDGIITVRGIGGLQSTVDTTTQNFFDATQAQSLSAILNNFTGQGGAAGAAGGTAASPTASVLSALQAGTLNPTTAIAALAAIVPQATKVQIGRQLSFYVTPYTLPGASSAELQVALTVGDSAEPTLYQAGNATGAIDTVSHVAQHNVSTRVRVESVKLFELSSFSALLQRPRAKFPLVPPFVELPLIGSVLSVPLPGAKEYHRSTAIVSAVIVPTATDLAYGIDFAHDRLITSEEKTVWGRRYEMRSVGSLSDFVRAPIAAFHKAMVNCLATHNGLTASGGVRTLVPSALVAQDACRSLDFRNVPPEF